MTDGSGDILAEDFVFDRLFKLEKLLIMHALHSIQGHLSNGFVDGRQDLIFQLLRSAAIWISWWEVRRKMGSQIVHYTCHTPYPDHGMAQ